MAANIRGLLRQAVRRGASHLRNVQRPCFPDLCRASSLQSLLLLHANVSMRPGMLEFINLVPSPLRRGSCSEPSPTDPNRTEPNRSNSFCTPRAPFGGRGGCPRKRSGRRGGRAGHTRGGAFPSRAALSQILFLLRLAATPANSCESQCKRTLVCMRSYVPCAARSDNQRRTLTCFNPFCTPGPPFGGRGSCP